MPYRSIVLASLASVFLAITFAGAPAFAADEVSGEAPVRGKDTRKNTIQLGDLTFWLDDDSVIRDAGGERVTLRSLAVPDFAAGGADLMLSSVIGRYVGETKGNHHVLRTLDLLTVSD